MTASDPRAQSVIDLLKQLRAGWPSAAWEWDGRFGCALSTLAGPDEARGRQALIVALPAAWTAAKLAEAPPVVRKLCAETGGLRGGQMVYSAELPNQTVVYCLWWPWGSGGNFSARIGAAADDGADLDAAVRAAFDFK